MSTDNTFSPLKRNINISSTDTFPREKRWMLVAAARKVSRFFSSILFYAFDFFFFNGAELRKHVLGVDLPPGLFEVLHQLPFCPQVKLCH